MGDPVRVYSPDGRIGTINSDRLEQARSRGYVPATPEETARRERVALGSDVAHQVVTGAAGTLRGVTAGLSEAVIEEPLGIREDVEAGMEANPTLATGAEVLGTGLGLFTGGTEARLAGEGGGLLAQGARMGTSALGAPTRAIVGASELAGRAVEGAVGTGGIGRWLLATAARYGTEGAIQGVGTEATHILTEEALGDDPQDIADRLIALGLLGGGLGAGLGGAGGLLAEGGRATSGMARATRDLLRRQFAAAGHGELHEGLASLAEAALRRGVPLSEMLTGDTNGVTARLFGAEGSQARATLLRGSEIAETGTTELTDALSRQAAARHRLEAELHGLSKESSVAAVVDTTRGAEQLTAAESLISDAQRQSAAMREQIQAFGGTSEYGMRGGAATSALEGASRRASERANEARAMFEAGTITEAERSARVFSAMDELRRQSGRAQTLVGRRTSTPVRGLFERLRGHLEDGELWGGAATLQRDTNAALHQEINWSHDFESMLMREGAADGFERVLEADSRRVASYLGGAGTAANATSEGIVAQSLQATDDLARAVIANRDGSISEGAMQAARDLLEASNRARSIERTVRDGVGLVNQANALQSRSMGGGLGVLGAGVLGGPLLGGVAAVAGAVANPVRSARMLAQLERLSSGTGERITAAVRGFLGRPVERIASRAVAAAERAPSRLTTGAAAYAARIAELDAHRDPTRLASDIAARTGDLLHAAPRVQSAVQARAATATAYLQAQRPRERVLPGALRVTHQPPSRPEMDRFLRIARAVDDPASVLDDLRNRRVTPEAVEAIRQVYPALYRQIVQSVQREMSDTDRDPSYQDRIQLGILLGVPTDPSLTPQTLGLLQQAHAMAQPQQIKPSPQRASTPGAVEMMASGADRVEARRAAG